MRAFSKELNVSPSSIRREGPKEDLNVYIIIRGQFLKGPETAYKLIKVRPAGPALSMTTYGSC